MALKATIFKADVSISDMDRQYYQSHHLTVARHPSETDARMMLRIVAFILNASDTLEFTKGLSEVDDPDLWQKSLTDEIELWLELGQPSEQRIKKGCNQAKCMKIYSYADNGFETWWSKEKNKVWVRENLQVITVDASLAEQLSALVDRNMQIQATIQDGQVWLMIGETSVELVPDLRKS